MTDSEYNITRLAQAHQNAGDTAPAEYRRKKNKRRNLREKNDQELEQPDDESTDCKCIENKQDEHTIDYQA